MSDFELERFERSGDRLVVSGRWSGVRGMRFMRPTLTVGEQRVLAVLDHKPWAPEEGESWIAAFPWSGDDVDPAEAELAVAPSLAVPLAGGHEIEPPAPDAPPDPAVLQAEHSARMDAEVSFLREQIELLTQRLGERETERDTARAELAAARAEATEGLDAERGRASGELTAARAELEGELERARAEAAAAREQAGDAGERLASERDDERARADELARKLRATTSELEATQQELSTERARLGVAHEKLAAADEELSAARDELDSIPRGTALVSAADKPGHPFSDRLATERELRAAARRRQRPAPRPQEGATGMDLWVPRVLASVAGVCMLILLIGALKLL